jgi:broad specificity phosphatase PhoE
MIRPPVPAILLVRHAQASFGAADYDVLSDHGLEQSRAVAQELAERGEPPTRVVSGALVRQRGTADAIAGAAGVAEVEVDPRWDEYASDDILAHHSDVPARLERAPDDPAPALSNREFQALLEDALLAWIAAGADGPAAEPFPGFAGRVADALTELAGALGSGETAVVCTSGGVIAATCVALLGVPAPAFVALNRVAVNAGISKVVTGRGGTTLVSFNEHAHLERHGLRLVTYR